MPTTEIIPQNRYYVRISELSKAGKNAKRAVTKFKKLQELKSSKNVSHMMLVPKFLDVLHSTLKLRNSKDDSLRLGYVEIVNALDYGVYRHNFNTTCIEL